MTTEPWASYDVAAAASRVVVRELRTLEELQDAAAVLGRIWGTPDKPPMSAELLRAMGKAESYVAGAFDAEHPGAGMVGVCVGFHSTPAARTMHSSRNAYFNLAELGARVAEYLPDFYGSMTDAINRGNDSDRILVHWSLDSPGVEQACAGSPVRATVPSGAAASWVQVPRDIEALRLTDPEQARGWRTKVRDQLKTALDAGGHVAGFDKEQGYLVLPQEGDLP